MAITPLKMLLFLGGASGAALGTAYTMGAFDPLLPPQMAMTAPSPAGSGSVPAPATRTDQPSDAAAPAAKAPEQQAALQSRPKRPAADAQAEPAQPSSPSFDLLRAEPDGSVVIAGRAAPDSDVEILSGGKVIGKAKATPEGDFAAVLDDPLKPGDYQISLRSKTPQKVEADSKETAVVSIPATKDGPVLAMVEQPGAPSRIITRPGDAQTAAAAPVQQAAPAQPSAATAAEPAPKAVAAPETPSQPAAKTAGTDASPAAAPSAAAPHVPVAVEAVEIEGEKLFVAGAAPPGAPVRVYANDQLLGETRATAEGRFLLEVQRDLAVGDYKVRADALAPDGKKVLARAEVGFNREPGETVAAVVPTGPAVQPATPGAEANPSAPAAQSGDPAKPTGTEQTQPAQDPAAQTAAQQAPAAGNQPVELGNPLAPGGLDQPPQLQAVNGGVIIRRGDSLWRISRRVYGRGVRYSTIYLANNVQIRDPNRIYPGQIFRVPNTTEQGEAADMKSIGDQATTIE